MDNKNPPPPAKRTLPKLSWPSFLETIPPGHACLIDVTLTRDPRTRVLPGSLSRSALPAQVGITPVDIELHCTWRKCSGPRTFATSNFVGARHGYSTSEFVTYVCRNCQRTSKEFAVRIVWRDAKVGLIATKFGELPAFGPPVPSRVISVVGPDGELFLRGRRAENQGLGIGAFAYYRRVVENQKARLIQQIGKVANRMRPEHASMEVFEAAAKETQFTKAIAMIKDVFPPGLLIKGHNPLALLHSNTSEGLHSLSKEDCLNRANAVRVVLVELADWIDSALKDEAELERAVSTLLNPPTSEETAVNTEEELNGPAGEAVDPTEFEGNGIEER